MKRIIKHANKLNHIPQYRTKQNEEKMRVNIYEAPEAEPIKKKEKKEMQHKVCNFTKEIADLTKSGFHNLSELSNWRADPLRRRNSFRRIS